EELRQFIRAIDTHHAGGLRCRRDEMERVGLGNEREPFQFDLRRITNAENRRKTGLFHSPPQLRDWQADVADRCLPDALPWGITFEVRLYPYGGAARFGQDGRLHRYVSQQLL